MSKIIIGNSQTSALADFWDHSVGTQKNKWVSENINCVWKIPFGCWPLIQDNLDEFPINEESTLLFYLGSSDIRNNLVKHDNTTKLVNLYVDWATSYANKFKSKVGFIHPVPVSIEPIFWDDDTWQYRGNGSKEEQVYQYYEFIKELDKISDFTISIINNVINSDTLTLNDTTDGCHLNFEKNRKLLGIIESI